MSYVKHEHKDNNMNHVFRGGNQAHVSHGSQARMAGYTGAAYGGQSPHHAGSVGGAKAQHQPPYFQGGMSYREYRDSSRHIDSPSKPGHAPPPTRNLLDHIDDVNNHGGGGGNYGDDRIQNELLKEICGDIGIDEAMDLDIFDFDAPPESYFYPNDRLQQNNLDFDGFGDLDGGESIGHPAKNGYSNQSNQNTHELTQIGSGYGPNPYETKVPSGGMEKGEYSPYAQSVPSVKSSDTQREVAIDSPTVSSSVPSSTDGQARSNQASSGNSCPASAQSSVGSPSVHSTTPSLQDPYESIKPPSSASVDSIRAPGSVESAREPSPVVVKREPLPRQDSADSTSRDVAPRTRRSESMGSPASQPDLVNSADGLAPSPGPDARYHSNTDLAKSESQYTSSFKSDVFTCYSQPASPSKMRPSSAYGGKGGVMHKAQSMNENLHRQAVTKLQSQMSYPPDSADLPHTDDQKAQHSANSGFKVPPAPSSQGKVMKSDAASAGPRDQAYLSTASTSSAYGGSQYGSSSNLSLNASQSGAAGESKDKARGYMQPQQGYGAHESQFDISSHPSTADLNIPAVHSENASASSSQSNSPTSMHIAKRARVIATGNDLLADVREQFSYVKGADMFAAPSGHVPPVQRARPTPYAGYGPGGPQRLPLSMQVPSQFNFGSANMPQSFCSTSNSGGVQPNANMNNNMAGANMNSNMAGANMSSNMAGATMPPQKAMYPGMNAQPRPNGAGYGPNSEGQMYPNNMYPSQSHNQAFNPSSNPALDMSVRSNPGMNTQQRNMHMQNRDPMNSMGQNMNPANAHMNVNMDMHSRGMRGHMSGPMSENGMDPLAASQFNSNQTAFMNHPRGDASMAMNKMDGMGNPVSSNGNYGNLQSGTNQYTNQSNVSQSQYGPSQTQMRPGPMGYHGNPGSGYRSQSPGYLAGNQNMNSMNQSMMPGSHGNNTMNMHGQNMNMQMSGGQYGNDNPLTGQLGQNSGSMPNMMPDGSSQQAQGAVGQAAGSTMPMGPMGPMGAPRGPSERLRPPPEGLMQQIISDRSSAFRSHPLFPLLRDLIIADMNFNTPSFPFQLIANLPADFDKLLQNYLNRNPPSRNQQVNPAVEGVIMDALKYAHQSLIEKIQVKKHSVGYQETPKPLSAIEDFCERFDRAVKNSFSPKQPAGGGAPLTPSKAPRTPGKSSASATATAPSTPKKEGAKTDNEKAAGTPTSKTATAGRNKVLPKEAVAFMLDWLREHQDNPYPNDDEKEMLISKTKLTINQINYWFTNARRRILPKWALQRYMEQQQHSPYGPRLTPM